MALTNAEKQARHRARLKAKLAELDALKRASLEGVLPALDKLIADAREKRQRTSRKIIAPTSRYQVLADLATGENKTGLAGEALAIFIGALPLNEYERKALNAAVVQRLANKSAAAERRAAAKQKKVLEDIAKTSKIPGFGNF